MTVIEAGPATTWAAFRRTAKYKVFTSISEAIGSSQNRSEVEDFWTEILPDDMLDRPRSSRIFYNGKFYTYPLKPFEALMKAGRAGIGAMRVPSYLRARLAPEADQNVLRIGSAISLARACSESSFKTYTEKVWGMSCKEISADWAAQRIKGLSLGSAIRNAFIAASGLPKRSLRKSSRR